MTLKKQYIRLLFSVAPGYATKKAFSRFATPNRLAPRPKEAEAMQNSRTETRNINGTQIQIYRWGNGTRKALLVHGWEGNGGSLGYFAGHLVQNHYEVVSFDGPGHFQSAGKQTNLFEYAELLRHFIESEKPDTIIAHSFGCAASVVALHDYTFANTPKKFIMIGTPNKLTDILNGFTSLAGIGRSGYHSILHYMNNRFKRDMRSVQLEHYLKNTGLERVLLIHDEKDKILPCSNARAIHEANPGSTLHVTQGLGHQRILWDKSVSDTIMNFIFNIAP